MGCGCNKANLETFVVTAKDGSTREVKGEVQARIEAAKFGPGSSFRKK